VSITGIITTNVILSLRSPIRVEVTALRGSVQQTSLNALTQVLDFSASLERFSMVPKSVVLGRFAQPARLNVSLRSGTP
jgi:hypothetical protein